MIRTNLPLDLIVALEPRSGEFFNSLGHNQTIGEPASVCVLSMG